MVPLLIGVVAFVSTIDQATGKPSGAGLAIYLVCVLVSIGLGIYNRYILAGRTGQSWGRKALNIRLLSEATGQPIGGGMAFVRDLAHILDGLPFYIGYLFPLWDAKRQTFADKILKTVVVPAV
jgi:uncharacterized RDD family membrane protein YckC